MNKQNFIRTAAVVFADDTHLVSSDTIKRKIIETCFIENSNKEITIDNAIDFIDNNLSLHFESSEIIEIINKSKYFTIRNDFQTHEIFVKLNDSRYNTLKSKTINSIENHIGYFIYNIYKGEINEGELKDCLYKYVYDLMNTNLSTFEKLIKSNKKTDKVVVDSNRFTENEKSAINHFLNWDNENKNKAIFDIISYSIEYCLISNNLDGANVFLNSLKNKEFFLDNNIIYRAIGINGKDRQNRITTFLSKCKQTGQKFFVSKFTVKEFNDTIDYHIDLLRKIPFNKINPDIFTSFTLSPSLYQFYHEWREKRDNGGFDLFKSYLKSEYNKFVKKYDVTEVYKIPYDEKDKKIQKSINNYAKEIEDFKGKGFKDNHLFDAQNTFLIEHLRENTNSSVTDTKYFFVSTDQKLREWDFNRSDFQPIALLPSHWLSLLLKYISRSSEDYKSFVSFIKLKHNEPVINSNELQIIVAGISQVTEDFNHQYDIVNELVKTKFEGIINGNNPNEISEKARQFASSYYQSKIEEMQLAHIGEIDKLKNQVATEKEINKDLLTTKLDLLREIEQNILRTSQKQELLDNQISRKLNFHKLLLLSLFCGFYIIIGILVYKLTWNIMEPWTYFIAPMGVLFSYLYLAIYGSSPNPLKYFTTKKIEFRKEIYLQADFLKKDIEILKEKKDKLTQEINEIKSK
jgi:hypothetical protein